MHYWHWLLLKSANCFRKPSTKSYSFLSTSPKPKIFPPFFAALFSVSLERCEEEKKIGSNSMLPHMHSYYFASCCIWQFRWATLSWGVKRTMTFVCKQIIILQMVMEATNGSDDFRLMGKNYEVLNLILRYGDGNCVTRWLWGWQIFSGELEGKLAWHGEEFLKQMFDHVLASY